MGISKHTDDEVREVAKVAVSVTDAMRRLGLTYHGFAHAKFRERLKELGITIVYNRSAVHALVNQLRRRQINDYLVLNGPEILPSKLRKRLVRSGIKESKCEWCGINTWRDLPLMLMLDHVSGDRKDNRLENLRILCPNCHTQTPTYAKRKDYDYTGAKKPKKKYPHKKTLPCLTCGKLISKQTKRYHLFTGLCKSCYETSHRQVKVPNRPTAEVLLKQISELGYTGTGRLYGVSDQAVRKWLRLASVTPPSSNFRANRKTGTTHA